VKPQKKILFVLPTLHAGGAENYALRFINYCKNEYVFYVISINIEKGDLHNEFIKTGAKIYYQSTGYINPIKLFKFYNFLKNKKFDTICSFNGNFGGFPLLLAKLSGTQNRIAFYRRSTNAFGNNGLKVLYNNFVTFLIRKCATKILSNSEFAFINFHKNIYLSDARFGIISNGVDASKFNLNTSKEEARKQLNIAQNLFVIGHVGRFDPAKNHQTIFKAAKLLIKQNNDILFLFCGRGTDSNNFKNELVKYSIQNNTKILGLRDDVETVYRAMDIFYFPSVTEGQPNALIEAMFCGIPIAASNIEPIKEAVPTQIFKHLVDPINVEHHLNLLQKIKEDIDFREKLIQKEWAVKKFNRDFNFELFKQVI